MSDSILPCQVQFGSTMPHPDEYISWPEEFLYGFTAIPQLQTTFSVVSIAESKLFEGAIKIGRALAWDKKHPISVWRATANGQNYIIKKVFQSGFLSYRMLM